MIRPAALSLAFLTLAGSAAADNYFKDRVYDFADIFRLRTGIPDDGEGYGAKARATFLAQIGAVHYEGKYAGLNRRALGVTSEERTEGGISFLYGSRHSTYPVEGNRFLEGTTDWSVIEDRRILLNLPYWDDGRGDLLGIGAEIATPVIAFDVGVSPSQAVDFLAGIFTIDPYNDDLAGQDWEVYEERRTQKVPDGADPLAALEDKLAEREEVRARIALQQLIESGQFDPEEDLETQVRQQMLENAAETEMTDAPVPEQGAIERRGAEAPGREEIGDSELDEEVLDRIEEEAEVVDPAETQPAAPPEVIVE